MKGKIKRDLNLPADDEEEPERRRIDYRIYDKLEMGPKTGGKTSGS